jgi:hypothetical protein
MIQQKLSESEGANLTNDEALKIGKVAQKKAEQIRKKGGSLADNDASYLDWFADSSFSRNLKKMTRVMNGGETDNREQIFKIVSDVIGKERAQLIARGKY